ncbi:hypothetical protein D7I43_08000 [Micromonospora globbae]|uniref:Uncharacterized protein n=1 Tax=Micromonospora globbae TaxID=1894969 RepID=A0A420F3X1_9ACTN|nr:hypothetical protein D7I43_08000 [Micromonospora globbae]
MSAGAARGRMSPVGRAARLIGMRNDTQPTGTTWTIPGHTGRAVTVAAGAARALPAIDDPREAPCRSVI